MKIWHTLITFLSLAIAICVLVIACNNTQPQASAQLSPDKMTDYIYEVIKAQRKVYGKIIGKIKPSQRGQSFGTLGAR